MSKVLRIMPWPPLAARLFDLLPGTGDPARFGFRQANGVVLVAKAGPDHQELARLRYRHGAGRVALPTFVRRLASLGIALEIQQLQDILNGALFADPATRPGRTVKDQIFLLCLDGKREFVRLTALDGGFDAAGSRAYRVLLAQGHYRCPHCRRADIDEMNHTAIVMH